MVSLFFGGGGGGGVGGGVGGNSRDKGFCMLILYTASFSILLFM